MTVHLTNQLGDFGTGTSTAAAATVNNASGSITTESLATAAGAFYTFVLTNGLITAQSVIAVTVASGTNTTAGLMVSEVVPAAGSATIKIKNTNAGALNGTIVINYAVLT
jgi:hypothetical protein